MSGRIVFATGNKGKIKEIQMIMADTGLEVVSCQTIGDPLNVAFNAKYILDILKNLEAEEAVLSMNTSLSPVCVTCADEPDYTYIVTPVRVVF